MTIQPAADLGEAGAEAPNLSMHALTGAFADPAHESAFIAQSFRLAFPLHVLLMVLCLAIEAFFISTTGAATQLLWLVIMHVNLLGLVRTAPPSHEGATQMPLSPIPHPNPHPHSGFHRALTNPSPNPNLTQTLIPLA